MSGWAIFFHLYHPPTGNRCIWHPVLLSDHDKLKDLHKCILNNVTYYQDQFIFPSNQCDTYRCICDKNFDESMDPAKNPHCVVREKCDLELTELYRFQMGCAPVYFGVEPTCPGGQYRCRECFLFNSVLRFERFTLLLINLQLKKMIKWLVGRSMMMNLARMCANLDNWLSGKVTN